MRVHANEESCVLVGVCVHVREVMAMRAVNATSEKGYWIFEGTLKIRRLCWLSL